MAHATLPRIEVAGTHAVSVHKPWRFVWAVALLAVVARLPFLTASASPDEAGFLQVARQWAPGGGALYGHYWVDRPPLLITLFGWADATGGLVSLRVLGCLAVALTVMASARATWSLAGGPAAGLAAGRAAAWTAVVSAALLVSPLLGSLEVNGELLSAPFVAAGILALVEATKSTDRRRAVLLAAAGGATGICAVLAKQNIIDVFLFASVFFFAGARWRTISNVRAASGSMVVGALVALGLVSAWTVAHGTSLIGVFDAMYPFRLRAAQVVSEYGSQYADGRGRQLVLAFLVSGGALLVAALLVSSVRRSRRDAAVLALMATVGYDGISIALGGSYWLHYLVELAVPLAMWTGVLVPRGVVLPRVSAVVVTAVSAVALVIMGLLPHTDDGQEVGAAISRVAQPGDTLTTLYGDATVNFAAGLPSPYEYLWSLPVKTLDPDLTGLDAVLSGPDAPTWLVVSHDVSSWGLDTADTQSLISTDYRPVADIDGQTVYLHDGVVRSAPSPSTPLASIPALTREQP